MDSQEASSKKDSSTQAETDEMVIFVRAAKKSLNQVIKERVNNKLRTNTMVQSRVNRRLLRGFEGFHGELSRLWSQVAEGSRDHTVKQKVMDQLGQKERIKNDKVGASSKEHDAIEFLGTVINDIELASLSDRVEKTGEALHELQLEVETLRIPIFSEVEQSSSSPTIAEASETAPKTD